MPDTVTIVEQHIGDNRRVRERVGLAGEFTRIVVIENGKPRVVYQGEKFSEEEFKKQMREAGEKSRLEEERIEI